MAELGWYSCRCILQESTLGLGGCLETWPSFNSFVQRVLHQPGRWLPRQPPMLLNLLSRFPAVLDLQLLQLRQLPL